MFGDVARAQLGKPRADTLTIRLPSDKYEHLKALAKSNSISINKLMDELTTVALTHHDACVRLETRAAHGSPPPTVSAYAFSRGLA